MSSVNESLKNEKLKADLITNVSHDIKTPLTSIVNYVDLLKRENLENGKCQILYTCAGGKVTALKAAYRGLW